MMHTQCIISHCTLFNASGTCTNIFLSMARHKLRSRKCDTNLSTCKLLQQQRLLIHYCGNEPLSRSAPIELGVENFLLLWQIIHKTDGTQMNEINRQVSCPLLKQLSQINSSICKKAPFGIKESHAGTITICSVS